LYVVVAKLFLKLYYEAMRDKPLLIVTQNKPLFFEEPASLSCDDCYFCSPEYLSYISYSKYSAIVIDSFSLLQHLRKVALGIRDDVVTSALWNIFADLASPDVYVLSERMQPPTQDMRDLGISYVTLSKLKEIGTPQKFPEPLKESSEFPEEFRKSLLTADDIRAMSLKGQTFIPAGARLTSWAEEVAATLKMRPMPENDFFFIYPVFSNSLNELESLREDLFQKSSACSNLLFLLTPLYLPVFCELYPSLAKKTLSTSIHWEEKGAYTGEVSADMLSSLGCFGALVPDSKPYKENFSKALSLANSKSLRIFSRLKLAKAESCDIIHEEKNNTFSPLMLYSRDEITLDALPESGAVLADSSLLASICRK